LSTLEKRGRSEATILNVDDDASCRRATTAILRREGFHVEEAGTGAEALRLVENIPGLVLLDVNLPDMSGIEVCRRIRSNVRTQAIPVLHISAVHIEEEDRIAGGSAGADAYLTRPVDPLLLAATIRVLLRVTRAEQATRETARQWQAVFDAVSHGVCILDRDGRLQRANRALAELTRRQPEELIGSRHDRIFSGSEAPADGWPFDRARSSHRRETAEVRSGERWFQITADPMTDDRGDFDGAVRSVIEITGLKRGEEERERLVAQLEQERARLDTILQQMPAGVIIVETGTRNVLLSNRRAEEIARKPIRLGVTFEQSLAFQLRHPGGLQYATADLPSARSIANGEIVTDELIEIVRPGGTRATISSSSAPIRDRNGSIAAAVVTFSDVTERLDLEHQLRQSQKMEAVGRLAGGVAHDFNNLLTIVSGYGQMVREALPSNSAARRDMDAVMEAAERATALTTHLLTFSRRQIVRPKVIDLNRLVTKMNRMLRRIIGEDIELTTALEPGLPKIRLDPVQVEQILLNLAVNSRDAMPRGGVLAIQTKSVKLDTATGSLTPGLYSMLTVSDTGTGMSPEVLNHLFEPFFTTKSKGKGTGLGLSTVYGIVKQCGGEILITSEAGQGAKFRIYFPTADLPHAPQAIANETSAFTGTETILVVEDEAEVRRLTAGMLSRQGYRVIDASSGAEALRLWNKHGSEIAMLLTDVIMPQMSGRELAERLKVLSPALKILYMSGYAGDVVAQHGVPQSETVFLHKPFTFDTLARQVRSVLDETP